MLPGQPSRTLLGAAIRRGQHQLLDVPLILHDPVVLKLVPEAADLNALSEMGDDQDIVAILHRALMAMRARFTEDCLAQAAERGARQYVMIGAGLDTFPWRQPDFARKMQIFAVDHPVSLIWTQRRLRERGMVKPPNLIHVPVDLENQRIGEQLDACGFQRGLVSLCSALGVIHYLNSETVDSLLQFVMTLRSGSEIVLSFVTPKEELDGHDLEAFGRGVARTDGLGEPWKYRSNPADFVSRLHKSGLRKVFHLTPELAQQIYFKDRQDKLRAPRWEQLVTATI